MLELTLKVYTYYYFISMHNDLLFITILDIRLIMIVLDLPSFNSLVVMMLSLSMVLTADNNYMNYNKIFQLQERGNCKHE